MSQLSPSKCETFGCPNPALQPYTIAPGTVVRLCEKCIMEAEEAAGGKYDKGLQA